MSSLMGEFLLLNLRGALILDKGNSGPEDFERNLWRYSDEYDELLQGAS
jgi:hypothetical protein